MFPALLSAVLAALCLVFGALATYGVLKLVHIRPNIKAILFVGIAVSVFTPVWVPLDISLALFLPSALVLAWLHPAIHELAVGIAAIINAGAIAASAVFFIWQARRLYAAR